MGEAVTAPRFFFHPDSVPLITIRNMLHLSKIKQAAIDYSLKGQGFENAYSTIPFEDGAKWAIDYCDQVIRSVLIHYEHGGIIDCIMADFDEIISVETDLILSNHGS
jgi:hypothetical protein